MQTQKQPSFYAIIPANVRYDTELAPMAKILYGEITALANKNGYCFASNKYFENAYKLSRSQVIRLLNSLRDKKYIEILGREQSDRKIYITSQEGDKNVTAEGSKNDTGSSINATGEGSKNDTHNNININNIKNTKKYTEEFERWYDGYPNKWNKQQTYKNYLNALKTHTAAELTAARDAYVSHIRASGTSVDFITRSTNFLGKKGEYIGWLERIEQNGAPQVQPSVNTDDEETAELIRRRREALNL